MTEPTMICTIVDGSVRLPVQQMHPKTLELLRRELTFPNPEYVQRLRYKRWTGGVSSDICLLDEVDDSVRIPRGAVPVLQRAAAAAGQEVSFEDRRIVLREFPFRFRYALRDYQREAMVALIRGVQGCAVVPCGGGKTVIAIATIAHLQQPALVIVHTKDLLDQWRQAVEVMLGRKTGVIADGLRRPTVITIATVQTLARLTRDELVELGQGFGAVIVDEAHHIPAVTFRTVLAEFPAKYRFGLTATPDREDGLTPLVQLCVGPNLFNIGHRKLADGGYLVLPKVVPVRTGIAPEAESHNDLVQALVTDRDRNRLIVDLVADEVQQGHSVLVLSGRVKHCERLARLLLERGVDATSLTGHVPRSKRCQYLGQFREGALQVLCATTLADEGLDISRLERLVLATPARAQGRTMQRLGRLMRTHPGKRTPILYDIVDEAPIAQRQFIARQHVYHKILGSEALQRSTARVQPSLFTSK